MKIYIIFVFHATNNPENILQDGFDENKIDVAFMDRGFYFSTDPNNLKSLNRKAIIQCRIKLNNPLTDKKIWMNVVNKLQSNGTPNLNKIAIELRNIFENMGYDGILAFNEYGWWNDVTWDKNDEIVVFRSENIFPEKIL